jgi:hypothetical protein
LKGSRTKKADPFIHYRDEIDEEEKYDLFNFKCAAIEVK